MIIVNDVKDSLMSKELKRKLSVGEKVVSSGLFVGRGMIEEMKWGNSERSCSKLNSKGSSNAKCYNCKEKGHFKRNCPQLKNEKFKSES